VKILFRLTWWKESNSLRRAFKSPEMLSLFEEYRSRVQPFASCEPAGRPAVWKPEASRCVWMCDRGRGARSLDSEALAAALDKLLSSGVREWNLLIGGADGFSETDDRFWRPDFKWSFGPLTLPHELASVVAAEQIYRAWTILKGMPYHGGH